MCQYRVTFDPRVARQWSQRNELGLTRLRRPNLNVEKSIRLIANHLRATSALTKNAKARHTFQAAKGGALKLLNQPAFLAEEARSVGVFYERRADQNKNARLAVAGRAFFCGLTVWH